EVVDVQLAVEVVELVLERAPEETRAGDLDPAAAPVLRHDPDLLAARDVGGVAWDRQAALEVAIATLGANDPRMHQLVEPVFALDHADRERLADLRSGESHPRRV